MVKIVLIFLVVCAVDLLLPLKVRWASDQLFSNSVSEMYRKYGLISFPRTLFAALACVAASVAALHLLDERLEIALFLFAMIAWGVCAMFDVFRSRN